VNAVAALVGAGLSLAGCGAPASARTHALVRNGRLGSSPPRRSTGIRPRLALVVAIAATAVVTALLRGLALGVAIAVAGATAVALWTDALRERTDGRRRAALLAALRLIVADLDAGARPDLAMYAAAEVCPAHERDLRRMAGALADGTAIEAGHPDLVPLAHACAVAARTGAPLAAVLGRVADDVEQAEARRLRLDALTAGPRASSLVLALLPVLGLVLGSSLGARPVHFLVESGAGRWLACAGVVFDALGVLWVRRILRGARQ
jgi:tight adherence protein B